MVIPYNEFRGRSRRFRYKKMWQANFERLKIEHLTFEIISNIFALIRCAHAFIICSLEFRIATADRTPEFGAEY